MYFLHPRPQNQAFFKDLKVLLVLKFLLDLSDDFGENEVLFVKIGAKVLDLWLDMPCLWKLVLGFWTYGLISPLPKTLDPSCSKPVFRPKIPNVTALGSKHFFISSSIKFWMKQALIFKFWVICDSYVFRQRQLYILLYRQSRELFWVSRLAK